ncbi:FTR1 family iron permease [Thermococcus thioreducens]|uniref:Ferrous iron transporter n=1 Tax=Thermococcus thioreducens TaxID=277988 RepID=A0A0Q2QQ14_9EURY|nr:FTR1 family protein [Thermococcus thioreducens]ASJ12672.1 ferrous iron transporter [Thermococcus thioreducens]KQH82005.1 ferrous iron transporter [Thermococcus thioreducens]SEV86934.1 high-affinity iron transporter [Thermococcus thioreducens]
MSVGAFLITFREALEAAIIVAIIIAYLRRTNRANQIKDVWIGTALSVGFSLLLGIGILKFYGGLAEKELFEGIASYLAVIVLTSMIYWMATKGKDIRAEIESKVSKSIAPLALIGFTFIVVFREGLETVLFLTPFMTRDLTGTLIGLGAGLAGALVLAYLIYGVGMRIDLRRFFYFSSILLVFVAAGLAGYGTHELIEWAEEEGYSLGVFATQAYDLGIPSDSIWHHKGAIGSIFAVLFGYSVSMEWGRVIVQFGYLIVALYLVLRAYGKGPALNREKKAAESAA